MARNREQWSSRIGFVLAATGSAIGLGNIWRFPTVVGQNGGGAFVLVYLIMIFMIGVPVLVAELTLGRKTQRNVVGAFKKLRPGTPWYLVGVMGVAAGFIILSFYSVIAGWSLAYISKFLQAGFTNLAPSAIEHEFTNLVSHPTVPLIWQGLFISMTIGIVISGVAGGIERWSKILMPLLIIIMIVLAGRSMTLEGGREGVFWLLRPDFANLNFSTILGV